MVMRRLKSPSRVSVCAGTECDVREEMDAAEPEHAARLEPLREFTLPMRDPRHEDALRRYATTRPSPESLCF